MRVFALLTTVVTALAVATSFGGAARVDQARQHAALASAVPPCGPGRVRSGPRCLSVWRYLRRRPVRVPSLEVGSPCPVATPRGELANVAPGVVGTAFGAGPAYPGLGSSARAELFFRYPPPPESIDYGSEWSGQKVMWILATGFHGPALVRGSQLDGPHELRFDRGVVPSRERRLSGPSGGYPSSTRLRAPGCYAYQVDGLRFTYLIVFKARLVGS
jgi:hypothetical protein